MIIGRLNLVQLVEYVKWFFKLGRFISISGNAPIGFHFSWEGALCNVA
jgi:hypothetical protein